MCICMDTMYQIPDRARYQIVPGTRSARSCQVPGTIRYLARSGTWHDLVPGTISPSIWSPGNRSALDNYLID